MNIALMSHDNKKELMVQFCTAYGPASSPTTTSTPPTPPATWWPMPRA